MWSPWRWRPLVWLGEISFAFYMVHVQFVQNVLRWRHRAGKGWPAHEAALVIPAFLAASVLVAWALYRLVELPMMRRLGPKRPRVPEPPVEPDPEPSSPWARLGGSHRGIHPRRCPDRPDSGRARPTAGEELSDTSRC